MAILEEIKDVKTFQQVASHLEKSTIRLSKENAKLKAEKARLRGTGLDPQMELELLKEDDRKCAICGETLTEMGDQA